MNKIININLAGQAIAIDEKAYDTLKKYLATLERHFRNTSSASEILEDIEARIAEMFQVKLTKGHDFINQAEVDEAIELMGNPSEMGIDEDEEAHDTYNESRTYTNTSKKLFRDSEDKMLGGVCSGVAAYLGLDVSMVRIATLILVLFGGISILPYVILWIVIPETRTAQDRFRMKGETPDIDNIARKIRDEAENVASNLKKNESINRAARGVGDVITTLFTKFGKVFGAIILVAFVIACVAICSAFIGAILGHTNLIVNGDVMDFPHIFDSSLLTKFFYFSLLALILIPLGTIAYLLICFIFGFSLNRFNLKAIFATWLICLAFFVGVAIFGSSQTHWEDWDDIRIELYDDNSV